MLNKHTLFRFGICFLWSIAIGCSASAAPTLTSTPPPSATETAIPRPTLTVAPTTTPTVQSTNSSVIAIAGGFFALSVKDVDASAKWYSEKLGLKIVMQPPKANSARVIVLEGGDLIVELIQHDDARDLKQVAPTIDNNILVHGIFKAGVVVQDIDKTLAFLKERNVPIAIGPFPKTAEQRANFIIRDNEGNLIQFIGK